MGLERIPLVYMQKDFVDHVYSNGEIVRIDKSASLQADLLSGLEFTDSVLWAGSTAPYKLYTNQTLSVYCTTTSLPFNKPLPFGGGFYGIKLDTVTGEKWYKIEEYDYSGDYDVKTCTYTESGELVGIDYYFEGSVADAKAYATLHGLSFPVPASVEQDVWLWGVYYGLESTPQVMKAYVAVEG